MKRSRYQVTKWYFPAAQGKYRMTRHNTMLVYDTAVSTRYEFDEVSGQVVNCRAFGPQRFLDATCVPPEWVPWEGDDTFAIADVNITTWCPPDQQHEFLPDHSLLVTNTPDDPVLAQVRVRQNGHYLTMLSVENWIGGYRVDLTIPPACAAAPLQPQPHDEPLSFYAPFWPKVYPNLSTKDA